MSSCTYCHTEMDSNDSGKMCPDCKKIRRISAAINKGKKFIGTHSAYQPVEDRYAVGMPTSFGYDLSPGKAENMPVQ